MHPACSPSYRGYQLTTIVCMIIIFMFSLTGYRQSQKISVFVPKYLYSTITSYRCNFVCQTVFMDGLKQACGRMVQMRRVFAQIVNLSNFRPIPQSPTKLNDQ